MAAWDPMETETPPYSPCSASNEENGAPALAQTGDGVLAVFPRLAGKRRPGVVVHRMAQGVVALPLTTRRTNQPGRMPAPEPELAALGFEKRSHILLPRAAFLPLSRIEARRGAVSEPFLAQLLGEMVEWYGLDWRSSDPALQGPEGAARLLHIRRRP